MKGEVATKVDMQGAKKNQIHVTVNIADNKDLQELKELLQVAQKQLEELDTTFQRINSLKNPKSRDLTS